MKSRLNLDDEIELNYDGDNFIFVVYFDINNRYDCILNNLKPIELKYIDAVIDRQGNDITEWYEDEPVLNLVLMLEEITSKLNDRWL